MSNGLSPPSITYTPMRKNSFFFLLLLGTMLPVQAQTTAKKDSTALKIGYIKGIAGLVTGSVDQVTDRQINKGLTINALSALNGQSAGERIDRP